MNTLSTLALSPTFINSILNNNFGIPTHNYINTNIYVGLGIEFDKESFSFTKEPVEKGFTILSTPCVFDEPLNGIIRNVNSLEWEKAQEDWTKGSEKIQYIGLYYKNDVESNSSVLSDIEEFELIAVLPLMPAETVLNNERMVLNANAIQLKLTNR